MTPGRQWGVVALATTAEPGPGQRKRGRGELEAQVLATLRLAQGPVTAGWVRERLPDALAYSTVITILTRLHEKHAVRRERSGRSFLWTPAADEAGLAALRMRRVLEGREDRDAVLASFVTALSPDDEQLLRRLLGADSLAELSGLPGLSGPAETSGPGLSGAGDPSGPGLSGSGDPSGPGLSGSGDPSGPAEPSWPEGPPELPEQRAE
ncbi:BlaI/MecI/CopY family transcriptional regulator [Streptomyces sedi]|uniref:BlaI/MecI/CopY family transcriptional regulator n=1 Tax=Streptomyces sedi TaxID=555059 RepID=A0A5C4UN46_9ACTN|nr:BlaI/MecI/CopY family transcriptional regulator [Streptomyces sedi]